tara:strand:+ start:541 stop:708 length:168 start_codon:yes stop_codon:yes gene_type:complete
MSLTTVRLAELFMHLLEQLLIQHEAEDPLRVYQLCADRCQAQANRLANLDPDRNK